MFIRYQHVRNVVLGLTAAGGIAWCALRDSEPDEPPEQASPSSTSSVPASSTAQSGPPEPAPSPAGSAQAQRYREVMRLTSALAPQKKQKDALGSGSPWKVNLYDDAADGRWDRVKLDRDRDDTWDEKWTRKGEVIERKLTATGKVLVFRGGAWVPKAP